MISCENATPTTIGRDSVSVDARDFWEMHDRLFSHSFELSDHNLRRHAEGIGLDLARFDQELRGELHAARVEEDFRSGARSGVPSTPRFFVNGVIHLGSGSVSELEERIQSELSRDKIDA